jgi:8-oxo-dGTP pyrophosphatase MutT (NUDIX family)
MSFDPNKFFVGLVDFFSILLPGALFIYLAREWLIRAIPQADLSLAGSESWVVFLILSYLAGHFAFLLGSTLDDLVYEPVREATHGGQIRRLARGKELSPAWIRDLAESSWLFGPHADRAVTQAVRIKTRALRPIGAEDAVNAFQWCKARLSKDHPDGLLAVQGFEAHSKFFRSFVVVLLALVLVFAVGGQWIAAVASLVLVVPALWRYLDQRFKSTQHAYYFTITLEAMREDRPGDAHDARPDGMTHAGGVVFRERGHGIEYLLIESASRPSEWVLPKGHIEPLEDPRRTAVREVKEETGHWAAIRAEIRDLDLGAGPDAPAVRWYLLEAVEEPEEEDEKREKLARGPRRLQWLSREEAIELSEFRETKLLLREADQMLSAQREGAGAAP